MTRTVRCPDWGQEVEVPAGTEVGDRFECPNWAGTFLRLVESDGKLAATRVHVVSCPDCGRQIEVPDGDKAGDPIRCCGREYRLTYEFGSYALEWRRRSGAAAG